MPLELTEIRTKMAAERARRRSIRWLDCAVWIGIGLLVAAGMLLALDLVFRLSPLQRAVVMTVTVTVTTVLLRRRCLPLLRRRESEVETALAVERQHSLESQLVSAIQFAEPAADDCGAVSFRRQVISEVTALGPSLRWQAPRLSGGLVARCCLLLISLTAAGALIIGYPSHALIFAKRLMLSAARYPAETRMVRIVICGRSVLSPPESGSQASSLVLETARVRRGDTVSVGMLISGPIDGQLQNTVPQIAVTQSTTASTSTIRGAARGLQHVNRDQRQRNLSQARQWVDQLAKSGAEAMDLASLLQGGESREQAWLADAPKAWDHLGRGEFSQAASAIDAAIDALPSRSDELFVVQLGRAVENLRYELTAGDAPAAIGQLEVVVPPVVQPHWRVTPPPYTQQPESRARDSQEILAWEGSRLALEVRSDRRPLTEVQLQLVSDADKQRFSLTPQDDAHVTWHLRQPPASLMALGGDLNFIITARDEFGVPVPPSEGQLRVRRDRPPNIFVGCRHRVFLPTAQPVIEYRINDDFGIQEARLAITVQQAAGNGTPSAKDESRTTFLPLTEGRLSGDELPKRARYLLDLSKLRLGKGDQLLVRLQARDDRGQQPGQSAESSAIVIQISDVAGVLSANNQYYQQLDLSLEDLENQQLRILSGDDP